MASYRFATRPAEGEAIAFDKGVLSVPNHPVIPFVEGDGTGPDEAEEIGNLLRTKYGKEIRAHSAIGIKPMSEFGSKRLVKMAMQYALENGRRSLTLVHKGNIMKFTEGAFRDWGYEVAASDF